MGREDGCGMSGPSGWRRLGQTIALAFIALCGLRVAPALAQAGLTAHFDYTAPERFAIPVLAQGDEAGEVYTAQPISPAVWPIHFDACGSTGSIAEYRWTVDGAFAGSAAECDGFSHDFASEGVYPVSLTVVDTQQHEVSTALDIVVEDWLIVALGDSYGSGEGNPDVPISAPLIDEANAAGALLASAEQSAAAAQEAYLASLASFEQIGRQVGAIEAALASYLAALATWEAECPSISLACTQATVALDSAASALLTALADAGLTGFELADVGQIPGALVDLVANAQAGLDAATQTRDLAVVAVAAARADLDAARSLLVPSWQSRRCHRSAQSGQVLAAKALAQSDPHSSVTFIHLACSGATLWRGLIGSYEGIEPDGAAFPPQVDRAAALVGEREIDFLVVSIGGNDVNFSSLITSCLLEEPCFDPDPLRDGQAVTALEALCSAAGPFGEACLDFVDVETALGPYSALEIFEIHDPLKVEERRDGLDDLPDGYQALQGALVAAFGSGVARRVLLTEYPDATRNDDGSRCGWSAGDPLAEQLKNPPGISEPEMAWLDTHVAAGLGAAMQAAATLHGWRLVDGIAQASRNHGYCANDHHLVRLDETWPIEGQIEGAFHPNRQGHLTYRDAILDALQLPEPGAGLGQLATVLVVAGASARRRRRLATRGEVQCRR